MICGWISVLFCVTKRLWVCWKIFFFGADEKFQIKWSIWQIPWICTHLYSIGQLQVSLVVQRLSWIFGKKNWFQVGSWNQPRFCCTRPSPNPGFGFTWGSPSTFRFQLRSFLVIPWGGPRPVQKFRPCIFPSPCSRRAGLVCSRFNSDPFHLANFKPCMQVSMQLMSNRRAHNWQLFWKRASHEREQLVRHLEYVMMFLICRCSNKWTTSSAEE